MFFLEQIYPSLSQFSRAVHYRINEVDRTIEQIWSFGEDLRLHFCQRLLVKSIQRRGKYDACFIRVYSKRNTNRWTGI